MTLAPLDTRPEVEAAINAIAALDLGPIKWALTSEKYGTPADMTPDEADKAIAQYKMLLELWVRYPEKTIVMTRFIDEVWHNHVLDTAKYTIDCGLIFGAYVHHFPYFGAQSPEAEQRLFSAFDESAALFMEHFGVDIAADSRIWVESVHRRMSDFYLERMVADEGQLSRLGNVSRCCNACGKCSDYTGDPATIELHFGQRMRA